MKLNIKMLLLITMVFALSACGTMNSSFDCPNKVGVSCKSLSEVNRMVDSGQIRTQSAEVASYKQDGLVASQTSADMTAYYGAPLRYGETVQRIWIAPYEDKDNNYHQDSVMYSIIKDGHWIGSPPKAIK